MSAVPGRSEPPDEGNAVHYSAVSPGTPIYSSDGVEVGRVRKVLDNRKEHIFDGVVFADSAGKLRFVDAPEVARTAERAVTLGIDVEQAKRLGPPEQGAPGLAPNLGGSRLGRLFSGGWKRR
jgi:hypothetical protein